MSQCRKATVRAFILSFLVGSMAVAGATVASAQMDLPTVSQTMEGGQGLLLIPSARTQGAATYTIGAKVLYGRRDYPVLWKVDENTDNTTIGGIPVTLGITDYLDLTGAIYFSSDGREYTSNLHYGISDYGVGSVRAAMKLRYPFAMDNPVQLAVRVGGMFDTSERQLDGLSYRWTRKGTDVDGSLVQTFDLGEKVSLHLEEGYTVSGTEVYDNQWFGGVGVEFRPSERLVLGLEADNRTYDGTSPYSVFQAGTDPTKYVGGAANIGSQFAVIDNKVDRAKDFFVVAPSLSYRLTERTALDLGVVVNVADQPDPKDEWQILVGLSFGDRIPWLADSDKDGVRNKADREANTPKGYPVDEFGVSLDSDKDGVPDGRDTQNNTPRGVKVDARGVGIDTDGDGVYDGPDKEVNTPKGYPVDTFGVALDGDKDGVPDGRDEQKNTPQGAKVDARGVGIDTDGDGVYDGIDKQVKTPKGYPVDTFGVALDGDKDGVPDGKDKELNTPAGKPVDQWGQALKEKERILVQEGYIRLNAVYFSVGKAVIKPESFVALNEAADILKKYPTLKIEVQRHTDNTGSAAKNRTLSTQRAQAVLDYLITHEPSLNRGNFTVVGYGPDKPVASNATADGRTLNRRVEFVVLNKEELQKPTTDQ